MNSNDRTDGSVQGIVSLDYDCCMISLDDIPDLQGVQRCASGLLRFPLRTPTLPPATHTNAYLLGSRRALWVEPASEFADEVRRALALMHQLEESGLRFEGYFATHHHADHVGGLLAMSRQKPLPVWAHPLTHERIAVDPRSTRVQLEAGPLPEPFSNWVSMHTPGHAPGHLCLFRPEDGRLIAGDMVAGIGTILVDPVDGDMGVYLESLGRLARLDASWVYPAHGEPIARERQIFSHYIKHRLARERRIARALREEALSLQELLPLCYADTPQAFWPLAERSLLSHLLKLATDGRAFLDASGWRKSTPL